MKNCMLILWLLLTLISSSWGSASDEFTVPPPKADDVALMASQGGSIHQLVKGREAELIPECFRRMSEELRVTPTAQAMRTANRAEMSLDDQKRIDVLSGYILIMNYVANGHPGNSELRQRAIGAIESALKSKYINVRCSAVRSLGEIAWYVGGKEVLELLKDKDMITRIAASDTIAKTGDESCILKVRQILQERGKGLSKSAISADWSFRVGYEALQRLEKRHHGNEAPNLNFRETRRKEKVESGSSEVGLWRIEDILVLGCGLLVGGIVLLVIFRMRKTGFDRNY